MLDRPAARWSIWRRRGGRAAQPAPLAGPAADRRASRRTPMLELELDHFDVPAFLRRQEG